MSYELGVRYGIPSTVIDPRPSASQKLNGMLTRRMKRITKNRLKEKQRKLCYSCIEVAGDSAKPDNGSSSVKEELSNTIDAIEAKPGVRLSDALSSESWTDILFSGDPTEGNTEIPVDQEVPMVLESIEHPLSVVGSNSNEISANDSKTESSDNAVAPSAGSAAALDDRNPLFQFLATSPIFRTAVYSAIGRPCPEVAELGTDSALDPGDVLLCSTAGCMLRMKLSFCIQLQIRMFYRWTTLLYSRRYWIRAGCIEEAISVLASPSLRMESLTR